MQATTQTSNFSSMFTSFFGAGNQSVKRSPSLIHWVIEEDEETMYKNFAMVKFYNAKNQLVHTEKMQGMNAGFLDDAAIAKISSIQKKLMKKAVN